jgi:hypothetical protein
MPCCCIQVWALGRAWWSSLLLSHSVITGVACRLVCEGLCPCLVSELERLRQMGAWTVGSLVSVPLWVPSIWCLWWLQSSWFSYMLVQSTQNTCPREKTSQWESCATFYELALEVTPFPSSKSLGPIQVHGKETTLHCWRGGVNIL